MYSVIAPTIYNGILNYFYYRNKLLINMYLDKINLKIISLLQNNFIRVDKV